MLLNPAGGLRYHLRAFRHGSALWQPFRWALGEWLLGWEPPERTVVVVGPSGGYTMQPFLFERFDRVVCLEPEPIARFVFQRRLAKAPLEHRPELSFITDDRLVQNPERLVELVTSLGDAALLFTNIVGQLRVLVDAAGPDAPAFARIRAEVQRALVGRSWASFHDRVSGRLRPEFNQPLVANSRLVDEEIVSILYGGEAPAEASPRGAKGESELFDHLTQGFFPEGLPHAYFVWELEPAWYHVIEGVRAVKGSPEAAPSNERQ